MYINGKYIEFTKSLQLILVIVYYSFYFFNLYLWYSTGHYPEDLLSKVSIPFTLITSAYLLKSAGDNKNKIDINGFDAEKDKSFSFSQILILIILLNYVLSLFAFSYCWVDKEMFSADLFEYVSTPLVGILPSWAGKAFIENKAKSKAENTGNVVQQVVTDAVSDTIDKVLDDVKYDLNKLSEAEINRIFGNVVAK